MVLNSSCEVNARCGLGRGPQPLLAHARKEPAQILQLPRRATLELASPSCDLAQRSPGLCGRARPRNGPVLAGTSQTRPQRAAPAAPAPPPAAKRRRAGRRPSRRSVSPRSSRSDRGADRASAVSPRRQPHLPKRLSRRLQACRQAGSSRWQPRYPSEGGRSSHLLPAAQAASAQAARARRTSTSHRLSAV